MRRRHLGGDRELSDEILRQSIPFADDDRRRRGLQFSTKPRDVMERGFSNLSPG